MIVHHDNIGATFSPFDFSWLVCGLLTFVSTPLNIQFFVTHDERDFVLVFANFKTGRP